MGRLLLSNSRTISQGFSQPPASHCSTRAALSCRAEGTSQSFSSMGGTAQAVTHMLSLLGSSGSEDRTDTWTGKVTVALRRMLL